MTFTNLCDIIDTKQKSHIMKGLVIMTETELGNKLREMYETTSENKTAMIHIFGLIYADEIKKSQISPAVIAKTAGISDSYKTEISKGMALSKYLELKPEYKNKF